MGNIIEIEGFHATTKKNADKIKKQNLFKPSTKDYEWLGKGIYFWTDYKDALFWVNNSHKNEPDMCIITAVIKEDENRILDLDIEKNMQKLDAFATAYTESIKNGSTYSPVFKNHYEMQCFYCELYKRIHNINVIIYSFPIPGHNNAGFGLKRKQMVVNDNRSISIKSLASVRKDDDNVV